MSRTRVLLLALIAVATGCIRPPRVPRQGAERAVIEARAALRSGDLDLAEGIITRARSAHPRSGAVRQWSSKIMLMLGRGDAALSDLQAALRARDFGGWSQAELHGEIGDLLLRLGRYGEAVAFLSAGQEGPLAATRNAWARVARALPYARSDPDLEFAQLSLVEGRLPRLLCRVGKTEHPFVIDTGANYTTLSRSKAAELGVDPLLAAGVAIDGTGQSVPVSVGVLGDFSLGDVGLGPQPVFVLEDKNLTLRDGLGGAVRRVEALVGLDVLTRFRMTLDPARTSVVFQPRRGLEEASSSPCPWVDGRLMLPVGIENRRLWFALDTGASHSSLTEAGLQMLSGGESRAHETFRSVRSPGGATLALREVRGLVLTVSEVRFRGVDLPVVDREPPPTFPLHGVLGANLLLRCRTTIDGARIRLEAFESDRD